MSQAEASETIEDSLQGFVGKLSPDSFKTDDTFAFSADSC